MSGSPESSTSKRKIQRAENQAVALEMRKEGYSFAAVAEQLDVCISTAYRYARTALTDITADSLDRLAEMRELEGSRLDDLLRAIYLRALGGDIAAINTAAGLIRDRRKLYGLDMPTRIEAVIHKANVTTIESATQLECLSVDELLAFREIAAKLEEEPDIVDAEFEE